MDVIVGVSLLSIGLVIGFRLGKGEGRKESAKQIQVLEGMVEEAMFKNMPTIYSKDEYDTLMDYSTNDPKKWN